jgi:aminopeptidase N
MLDRSALSLHRKAMSKIQPSAIHIEDYTPTEFAVSHVELRVDLYPTRSIVESVLHLAQRKHAELVLHGEGLEIVSVAIDGRQLGSAEYGYTNNHLTIFSTPQNAFQLAITQVCNPQANTALSGLYLSNGTYCTQMEAEGFRRFAFMYDRPDVMVTYDVRIEAPQTMPVLLANGNPGRAGQMPGTNRHFAEWHDPHPKPTYLFALVAGDLASVHDHFTTMDGKNISLGIYVEKGKEDRCSFAMQSLKASMLWDEKRFGRAYDLDVFNIVAVSDFNMGAMENKGLNIFNDKYVLARPDTATDTDYINIERIIAHEYFHNWTGNRITCRDWFQLCLKEGLTVYRDQEFTADMRSRAVKRIEDVITLRARQFPEDQGPLAHPVRPSSYIEINNFYTPTVYEKGAELCRMMHWLIGDKAFCRAMDIYFERHDGDAATVEDFLACMAEASGRDLSQFKRWYLQAGTPRIKVATSYDAGTKRYCIELTQVLLPTPDQTQKLPLHIPLSVGLLGPSGHDLPLVLEITGAMPASLIELTDTKQTFTFCDVPQRPVLSINRGFTSPVIIESDVTEEDLLFVMGHDSDSFNRWEACRCLALDLIVDRVGGGRSSTSSFADALARSVEHHALDDAFKSLMLRFPTEQEVAAKLARDVDAEAVHIGRNIILSEFALQLRHVLLLTLDRTAEVGDYAPDQVGTGRRALRGAALALLARCDADHALALAQQDFETAQSMTAETAAVAAVLPLDTKDAAALLANFHMRHRNDPLLLDKWFLFEASKPRRDAAAHVQRLTQHADFSYTTPNRVYALLGGFTNNQAGFHAADGAGYAVLADSITKLDGINPQVASRMATGFRSWRQFEKTRRDHADTQMRRILASTSLSPDVYEIISRTLNG